MAKLAQVEKSIHVEKSHAQKKEEKGKNVAPCKRRLLWRPKIWATEAATSGNGSPLGPFSPLRH